MSARGKKVTLWTLLGVAFVLSASGNIEAPRRGPLQKRSNVDPNRR
jgi:hypothetical protein